MKLVDGKLVCRSGHEHTAFIGLVLCEGSTRERLNRKDVLVRAGTELITWENQTYVSCPSGHLHDADRTFDVIECDGVIQLVKAGVDHAHKRWVVANCRHLHPEKEVFQASFCDHGESNEEALKKGTRDGPRTAR